MVIDALENAGTYAPLHRRFAAAFGYLTTPDARLLEPGRRDVDGQILFALVSRESGKKKSEAKLEVHRKYIDIHYIISGVDTMGWKPARNCANVLSPYEEEKDIAFFGDEPVLWCDVFPGSFAIFFPSDAHAPMISTGEVHKVILKIAV